jgi:predicted DNA-binding WGR domain protein
MVEEHQRNASARRSEERLYAALRKKGLSDEEIAANRKRVRRVIENGARK